MADEAQPVTEETMPEVPVVAEEPKKHQHSETILKVCDELEIGRESAELLDGPQLRTEIEDAQRLFQVRQAKRGFQAPAASQQAPAPVVAEEEVKLTPEEEAELEHTPLLKRTVLEGKRAAAQTAKLQRELEAVKARSTGSDAEQEVKRLLADVPTPVGVSKEDRDTVVMKMIAAHHQAGHFQNVPFAEAVLLMQKKYQPAAPAKAVNNPTPTRVHAPTNRLNEAEEKRLAAAAASNSAANNGFGEP